MKSPVVAAALGVLAAIGCTQEQTATPRVWECLVPDGSEPEFANEIGCESDFDALASEPLDASIPGARSVKTVIDRIDGKLYFQNSRMYPIHWNFASEHLSGMGHPIVPDLAQFNTTEYYSPDRRFILGAVTVYEGAAAWTYEIAPYDTSTADMIEQAFETIASAAFFGNELLFHPTSEAVAAEATKLSIDTISTDELYEGVDFQPLNLGTSLGRLRFLSAADLETQPVDFRDIVVLDAVPNDISVVMGIITAQFQTPLSHINVLSQNRHTPNMALRGAQADQTLLELQDKWVRLKVGAFDWSIEEVTRAEADAWWDLNKPAVVQVPSADLTVSELADAETLLDSNLDVAAALDVAIPAYGGKASHFAATTAIGDAVPMPKAFAIPVFYYWQFLQENGFDDEIAAMLADPEFADDPVVREARLAQLRADMEVAPINPDFLSSLRAKLVEDYGGIRMRFRSSTNAEDLDGFTGAGLYISWTAAVDDPQRPIEDAVRKVWASVWYFRAFEERRYRSIAHEAVGMAMLVHRSFSAEEANGVALTANPYDTTRMEPGFYVNVQRGEASVVKPMPGVSTDQFIYHYDYPGQPIVFMAHSNLIPENTTVLTTEQTYMLGTALKAINEYYRPVYGTDRNQWWAMDVEFKLEGEPFSEPKLYIKQARPHYGWGG